MGQNAAQKIELAGCSLSDIVLLFEHVNTGQGDDDHIYIGNYFVGFGRMAVLQADL